VVPHPHTTLLRIKKRIFFVKYRESNLKHKFLFSLERERKEEIRFYSVKRRLLLLERSKNLCKK